MSFHYKAEAHTPYNIILFSKPPLTPIFYSASSNSHLYSHVLPPPAPLVTVFTQIQYDCEFKIPAPPGIEYDT